MYYPSYLFGGWRRPSPVFEGRGWATESPDNRDDDASSNEQIPFTESDESETDSALGDVNSVLSSTVSLSQSVFDYRTIYGRTYQVSSTTEYWCPNDEVQNRGLDIAHQFITMLLGGRLFEAPITKAALSRVLDIGTGTGIWTIDMADDYPAAEVIGTDISPIQPSWVPPNCSFHLEDAQLEWTFTPANFDFVHLRALNGCIDDWQRLYRQAHNALKSGGWIEHFEFTVRLYSTVPEVSNDPCHIFRRWADVLMEAGDRMGKSLRVGMDRSIERHRRNTGFVNITSKTYQVPVGAWSSNQIYREIGSYNLAFMMESLQGFALFLLREIMGWERTRIEVFIAEMRGAVRNSNLRPYYVVTSVYAQKPETPSSPAAAEEGGF